MAYISSVSDRPENLDFDRCTPSLRSHAALIPLIVIYQVYFRVPAVGASLFVEYLKAIDAFGKPFAAANPAPVDYQEEF